MDLQRHSFISRIACVLSLANCYGCLSALLKSSGCSTMLKDSPLFTHRNAILQCRKFLDLKCFIITKPRREYSSKGLKFSLASSSKIEGSFSNPRFLSELKDMGSQILLYEG